MRRLVATLATFVLVTAVSIDALLYDDLAGAAPATNVTLSLGDEIRVQGADMGCRVAHLAGHGKRLFVECRRSGPLAGTYGTYFGKNDVVVVRFLDRHTARVVLEAQHEARAKRCRTDAPG
jgi:hypothetical protein